MTCHPLTSQILQGMQVVSTGYTVKDNNFARLFKAATQTSEKVLSQVLLIILTRITFSNLLSSVCLTDYFIQILGWSNAMLKNRFNASERKTLKQNPINTSLMDVTLLCKLIQSLIQDLKVSQELKDAVKNVQDMRNRVCHEQNQLRIDMDQNHLIICIDELKRLFGTLFDQIEKVFGVKINRRVYYAEVDEIRLTPIDVAVYFRENVWFRSRLSNEFKARGRMELSDHYSKLEAPFAWRSGNTYPQLQVDQAFTDPLITNGDRDITLSSLLITEKSGEIPEVVLLSGIAGSGKTSLCHFMLHDWRKNHDTIANINSMDILLHIQASNETHQSLNSFLQTNLLEQTCRFFDEKNIQQIIQELRVLYVIDGFDESKEDTLELIEDVFSITKKARIVITTRPEFETHVTDLSTKYKLSLMKLKILGFSEEGSETFISRTFTAFVQDQKRCRQEMDEFINFLRKIQISLPGVFSFPFTLAFLVCLWQDNKDNIKHINSGTALYSKIFKIFISKLLTRLRDRIRCMHSLEIEKKIEVCFSALGETAFKMLYKRKLLIDREERDQLCMRLKSQGLPDVEVLSAFLECKVHTELLEVHHNWSFVHQTQMEYLAGFYISSMVMSEHMSKNTKTTMKTILELFGLEEYYRLRKNKKAVNKILSKLGILKYMDLWRNYKLTRMWPFVVGHLCLHKADDNVIQAVLEVLFSNHDMIWNADTIYGLIHESGMHRQVMDRVRYAVTCNTIEWFPTIFDYQ